MANYSSSNLVAAQAKLLGAFQSGELRFRTPATFLEFLKSGQIMFPNFDQLRTREDRTVNTYYNKRTSRALGSARSHNHTGSTGDSAGIALSWTTYADVFSKSLKQSDNNLYSAQEMYNNEIMNVIANFAESFESAAATYLSANKSGVNAATSSDEGAFDADTDVFEIATANEKRGIQILQTVMDINKYSGMKTVFCDSIAWNKVNFYANQGQANSENLQFQFAGVNFVHTPALTALGVALGYSKGYMIAAQLGTFAVLPWIPKQNRDGIVTSVNMYGSLLNPVDGLTYAIHEYETRADCSLVNGYTQDVTTETQVSLDLAWTKAPLSADGETPFLAFGFVESIVTP